MRFYSFCSIMTCLFEIILMPKSSLQECYMMLTAVWLQNLMICLFHCILCVHPMGMSSTCVLHYIMPYLHGCLSCIFWIYVVTSTSMQSSLRDVADFCDLVISAKSESVMLWCHVNLLLQVIQAHQHVYLSLFLPCSVFLPSLNLFMELAMFTWVPSYLLCLFGSWSVRDFCSMQVVESCHGFVCYDMFL